MVLGGDGTMLEAAHQLHGSELPLMGLNLGDLGYLTSVEATRAKEALMCLREGHFTISRRAALANVLVRPDGHILAVVLDTSPAARGQLEAALASLLAMPLQGAA